MSPTPSPSVEKTPEQIWADRGMNEILDNRTKTLNPIFNSSPKSEVSGEWDELREKLADIEHQRWADWQKYVHDKLDYSTGKYVLSDLDFEHWTQQIHTPYCNLTDREKKEDMKQVDRYWPLIMSALSSQRQSLEREHKEWKERFGAKIDKLGENLITDNNLDSKICNPRCHDSGKESALEQVKHLLLNDEIK